MNTKITSDVDSPADLPSPSSTQAWQKYRYLASNSSEVVVGTDPGGRIQWASPSVTELLGLDQQQVIGLLIADLVVPADRGSVLTAGEQVTTTAASVDPFRCTLNTPAGQVAWTMRIRPEFAGQGDVIGLVVTLVDKPDGESALRALATLSQANRCLVRAADEAELLRQMCVTITEVGGYALAWYGRGRADAKKSVTEVAAAGDAVAYLQDIHISWADDAFGNGPTGRSLRLRQTQVENAFTPDPQFSPWKRAADRHGLRSSISIPVFVESELDGALVVYSNQGGAFDSLAQTLLEDIAADLGLGIARLRAHTAREQAVRDLAASENRYRLLAENASDVILLSDAAMTLTWVSSSARNVFGWSVEELTGRYASEFIHPDDLPALRSKVAVSEQGREQIGVRYRWRCADGSYLWMEAIGRPISDDGTGRRGRVVVLRNIDAQVRAESELVEREARYRLLAENASDVVWEIAPDGTLQWVSPSGTRVIGWTPEQILGRVALDLVDPLDRDSLIAMRSQVLRGKTAAGEVRILTSDGTSRWMSLTIRPVFTEQGVARIAALRDIEGEVQARQSLDFVLGHDQLTGLPNLDHIKRRIDVERARLTPGRAMAVLCVGVDGLAQVNEAFTHSAGDLVLSAVAARIVGSTGEPDLVGRSTGDEFIVVLTDLRAESDAGELAEDIRKAIAGPIEVSDRKLMVTASLGVATGAGSTPTDQLLRDATLALRRAKNSGRDRCEFADPAMAVEAQHQIGLAEEVRAGLTAQQLRAWFQPIVALSDARVRGYEALVRWEHREGLRMPGSFLPIAERSSLICEIDVTMLEQAVVALASLPSDIFIAVNVSANTLSRMSYADTAAQILADAGVDPARLHLEVTETALLTLDEQVRTTMQRLREVGVKWYVDDFGTGYSSISHLRDLPVDGLKLDMSFTFGLAQGDPTAGRLAVGLVGLAKGLELDTVAEGVETDEVAQALAQMGWVNAQGWLYGKASALPGT